MSALDDAAKSVTRSDVCAFDHGAETRAIRDAVRALIQHVEVLETKLNNIITYNELWDGS